MERVAVFVDAGYLFAQGSTALTGNKQRREMLVLDPVNAREALTRYANLKAPSASLLRIYWYDGARGGPRPTTDQAQLANLDNIKLRLGFVNDSGEQKGVDSLIVTDLIELARLKSVSEAVLVSGDEDVRVGVQIAQNYGVRVHLLGIAPARGSQSHQLMQEADTTGEWDAATIASFLSVREPPTLVVGSTTTSQSIQIFGSAQITSVVVSFVESLTVVDLEGVRAYWKEARGIPSDLDKRLLVKCRDEAGRNLERDEIRVMRSEFQRLASVRLAKM
jgi:uncharacterized LabA/DUF88 family protein